MSNIKRLLKSQNKTLKANKYLYVDKGVCMPVINNSINFGLNIKGNGKIKVDWKDGNIETFTLDPINYLYLTHTWATSFLGTPIVFNIFGSENITYVYNIIIDSFGLFGFDIKYLPNLEYFNITSNNKVTGDIANCPNLNTLRIGGFSSIYGDISNLLIKAMANNRAETIISLSGLNRLSGVISATGLNFSAFGHNTFSGVLSVKGALNSNGLPLSVALSSGSNTVSGIDLEAPSYVNVTKSAGSNISFSGFDYKNLCLLAMSKTIFTQAQQNEILQGVWDNRDVVKTRAERSIDIRGDASTPVLDAAGLYLKALLQAYITPGVSSTTWIILNR